MTSPGGPAKLVINWYQTRDVNNTSEKLSIELLNKILKPTTYGNTSVTTYNNKTKSSSFDYCDIFFLNATASHQTNVCQVVSLAT